MLDVRRLIMAGAVLAIGIVISCASVWGDPSGDKAAREKERERRAWLRGEEIIRPVVEDATPVTDDVSKNRFVDLPVISYAQPNGDYLLALQIQPKLPDAPALPTDYLVMVDTSASKAMGHLSASVQMVEELCKLLKQEDRLAIWTANISPKDLTRGFKSSNELDVALKELHAELPLGAVDLEKCLATAVETFEPKQSRRRAVIFFGDGKSVANPLGAEQREKLVRLLAKKQAAFYPVPMGVTMDPANLHGLSIGSGGKTVRHGAREKPAELVARLLKVVAEPILQPSEFSLPGELCEMVPSVLPPLRRDQATLVIAKVKAGNKMPAAVNWKVSGELAGEVFRAEATLAVPAAEEENFFLAGMYEQWRAKKTEPALLPADRALGFAYKQNQLALEDVLAKADTALEQDNVDAARKLYVKAMEFAPHSKAAQAGLKLIEKMNSGKKTRAQILAELRLNGVKRTLIRFENGERKVVVLADGDEKPEEPKEDPADRALADVKARKEIARQQAEQMVAEAIRQANRIVTVDPDQANRMLKQTLEGVQGNTDLDPKDINEFSTRLARSLETINRIGAQRKRDAAEAAALRAAADARLDVRRTEMLAQERVRERMRVFHNLMDQARELEAERQAEAIRQDLVNQGLPVPPAVTAAYRIGQASYHLREQRDMRRIREDRFLAVLLEVDRSHVPFPDEPAIEFPSNATIKRITRGQFDNWSDFSKYRISRYGVTSFGADVPGRFTELRDLLNKTVDVDFTDVVDRDKAKLGELLDYLAKRYSFAYSFEERAFREPDSGAVKNPYDFEVRDPQTIKGRTTLGNVLKKLLAKTTFGSPLTYIIRRDEIEITTEEVQRAEKALRVYPVADLVFPTLNAFNPAAVGQVQNIGAGGFPGALGVAGGLQFGALGQFGLAGGLQLGLQVGGIQLGLQVGGLQLGLQVGGIQLGLQVGQIGVGGQIGQLGQMGLGQMGAVGFNCQGAVNLGVGGGFPGFTGGQLGQLGNLGGQFGLQGGSQEQLLIQLIRQVVGKPRDWAMQYNPVTGQPCNPLDDQDTGSVSGVLGEDNQLGYYPPAFALTVKGTTRLHTRESNVVFSKMGAADAGAGGVVKAPEIPGRDLIVGNDGKERDPKEIWPAALKKGPVEPGMVIATADFLVLNKKWDHAAEFLKANLREGVVVQPWVFKSLSLALREAGATAEEIERAEVSIADMEPMDAQGYLVAARALAEDKNYPRAIAFCKQAANLLPGTPIPFAEAARFAEMANDADAMQWAAGHLLKQDWPVRNDELKQTTLGRVEALARKADKATAERLKATVHAQQRRDLVIKLLWQGEADLDLKIQEPTGTICSALNHQTIAGGTMLADSFTPGVGETYTASEAFNGEYKVFVDRIWGKPLGGKAQVKIIRNQGTPDETEQLIPLKIDSDSVLAATFTLETGRRTETAYVPPSSVHSLLETELAPENRDAVLSKLISLSEPEVTGVERGLAGGIVGGAPVAPRVHAAPVVEAPKATDKPHLLYQSRIRSLVNTGTDVTAQAMLSADRRSVRVNVKPVFNTLTDSTPVKVLNPVIPGAGTK